MCEGTYHGWSSTPTNMNHSLTHSLSLSLSLSSWAQSLCLHKQLWEGQFFEISQSWASSYKLLFDGKLQFVMKAPFRLHPLVHSLAPRMVSMVVAVAFMEPCCVAPYQFFRCHLPFSEHVYVQYLWGLTDSKQCPEKVGPRMTLPDSLLRLELALLFHLLRHSSLLMIPQQEAWWIWWGLPGPVLSVLSVL